MRDIKDTFVEFMDRAPFYGTVVACNDDPMLRRVLPQVTRRVVTYGTRKDSDFRIRLKRPEPASEMSGRPEDRAWEGSPVPSSFFNVVYRGRDLGEFELQVPGLHNVLNATAAVAVGIGLDIPLAHIRQSLGDFRGVDRRFQLRGTAGGIAVIDDYGHHPTEIRATLAAARQCAYRKIHVIFQPHRYTRTRDLMDEFTTAFSHADSLFVLDIYPASEQPIEGVTGEALARRIAEKNDCAARYVDSFEEAVNAAAAEAREGDMILTLGAGSVSQLGPMLLEKLQVALAART
jgi:UDP-N-acetylmuramate--alanine ligase